MLVPKPLNSSDRLAFNLHMTYIMNNPENPKNIIIWNFCKRTGINYSDMITCILAPSWPEQEHELRVRGYI